MDISKLMRLVRVAPLALSVGLTAAPQADPKADDVLKAARAALGGESTLAKVQSLSITGASRRMMGDREIAGDATVDLLLPDKMRRTDSFGIPGGPTMERVSVLNGDEVWDDSTNRGGGGGFMRFGGPGGPGGPGGQSGPGGRAFTEEDRQRFHEMQIKRMKNEFARYSIGWLLRPTAAVTYTGIAEADDGKADVLEIKPEGGTPVKLFVDQQSHLPLMLTYEGPLPRMVMRQAGQQPPSQEEIEKMRREPPQTATFEVRFSDYKKVDGVLLPHLITTGANGKVTEEWTVDKYKVNPVLKPESFVKKGS
jgi:hypothetical protein